MKLAAIDIGSNAARLLITEVIVEEGRLPNYVKLVLLRVPLRLGFDVFETGKISPRKIEKLSKTMSAFKILLDVYEVAKYRICATSAMRDALNAHEVVESVFQEAGLRITVISGEEEAALIYENHVADGMDISESYLYIDVGGGSTELTFFSDGNLIFKRSFDIGTIRLLKGQVQEKAWDEMKRFLKEHTKGYHHVTAIGSGGNINKVFSLSKKKDGKPLSIDYLRELHKEMSELDLNARISRYKMREDRADVIVPALSVYINAMRWSEAEEIYVPKIGVADGIIHFLYEELLRGKS
jgi:exopolyphosphatase / guanosine-5'-triphosphate,3'-diphosphate pyrophosphatase